MDPGEKGRCKEGTCLALLGVAKHHQTFLNIALRVLPFLDHTITPAAHQNPRKTPQGTAPLQESTVKA